jgi:hypothetical protein
MPKPYNTVDGYYMYGISEYDQPSIPYYNASIYHKGDIREFPCKAIKDDGAPYLEYITPNCCLTCKKCNGINRTTLVNTFVNIQSYIDKILVIKLYGITKDLDKTIKLKIGNKYCISYITERGLATVTGVFKEISENTPDECITYIGNFGNITTTAYIGLDCSTEGQSDKRLIYIGSIRNIQEIYDENDDPYNDLTQEEKIIKSYSDLQTTIESINEFIENGEFNYKENSLYFPPPPPPPPQPSGPYIIGARPSPPPPPNQEFPIIINENKETVVEPPVELTILLEKMNVIKGMLNSFITEYINKENENNTPDNNNCDCNDDQENNG